MADWVGKAGALLEPLVAKLRAHVFAGSRLHGDDTPVLEPGKGKTKTGRLWSYVRDGRPWGDKTPPSVAYFYSPDRRVSIRKPTSQTSRASCMPMAMPGSATSMKQPNPTNPPPSRRRRAGRMSAASSSI